MSSMMLISLVVLYMPCLVLPVQGQLVTGEGPDFFNCGDSQCIDEANVTCHNNTRCTCPADQTGDARIQCAHPDDSLCTFGEDSHIISFSSEDFTLALPCAHTIVDFNIQTTHLPEQCGIIIKGKADFVATPGHPFAAFETQVDIMVFTRVSLYTARIIRGQKPVTEFKTTPTGPDFAVEEFSKDGFVSINIPKCDLSIQYKSDKAFLSVFSSNSSSQTKVAGMCSVGGGVTNRPGMDEMEKLKLQLHWLDSSSPYDYNNMNIYPECTDITTKLSAQQCPRDRKDSVINFCGNLLIQETTRSCLYTYYSDDPRGLMKAFLTCIELACALNPCSSYRNSPPLSACPFDGMEDLLKDPTFCQP